MSDRVKYTAALAKQRRERELATATVVPYRITMALDFHGLVGPEVDIACGGVEPMVDEWEAGTRVPTAEQLRLLAKLTGFPVSYFFKPAPVLTGPIWVCRRGGPKKDRCQHIAPAPPAPPAIAAALLPLPRRPATWRCLITGCPTRGRAQHADDEDAATGAFNAHYRDCHYQAPTSRSAR